MLRVGGAVLRERARQRRLLLIEVVLLFFVVQLNECLARRHAIAEVREDAADLALGFGRHGDLIDGRQGPNDFDGAADRFLADLLDLDRLDRGIASARLRRFGFRAAGRNPGQTHHSHSRNCSTHSLPIIRSRTDRMPV